MFDSYLTFDILIGPDDGAGLPLFARGPGGEARGRLRLPDDDALAALLAPLTAPRDDELALEALGHALFQALFDSPIRDLYARTQGLLQPSQGVRLSLTIDQANAATAALPWEFISDPAHGPLALLDVPLLRFIPQQASVPTLGAQLLVGLSLSTVAWSPDSRRLLGVVGRGSPSTAYLWDAATGSVIETIDAEIPDATVLSAGWSGDGMRFNVNMGVPTGYAWTQIEVADYRLIAAELTRRICRSYPDGMIAVEISGWRGCAAELAAITSDLARYNALWLSPLAP